MIARILTVFIYFTRITFTFHSVNFIAISGTIFTAFFVKYFMISGTISAQILPLFSAAFFLILTVILKVFPIVLPRTFDFFILPFCFAFLPFDIFVASLFRENNGVVEIYIAISE